MEPEKNLYLEKLQPFLGRTFYPSDRPSITDANFKAITAANISIGELLLKLEDLSFQEDVKVQIADMVKSCKNPLMGYKFYSDERVFSVLVKEIFESLNETQEFEDGNESDDEPIYSPHIISWGIRLCDEDGFLEIESWCPIFDSEFNIKMMGGSNYNAMIFKGIPAEDCLRKFGEAGFVAAFILAGMGLPSPPKTLEEITIDSYWTKCMPKFTKKLSVTYWNAAVVKMDELYAECTNESEVNTEKFYNIAFADAIKFASDTFESESIPKVVREKPYFKRLFPELWQRIIWLQHDELDEYSEKHGHIETFGIDGSLKTSLQYKLIYGIQYTDWIRHHPGYGRTIIIYNNDLEVIGQKKEFSQSAYIIKR